MVLSTYISSIVESKGGGGELGVSRKDGGARGYRRIGWRDGGTSEVTLLLADGDGLSYHVGSAVVVGDPQGDDIGARLVEGVTDRG